jgi:hypothetical protein
MENKKKSNNWIVFAVLVGIIVLMVIIKVLFL